RCRAYEHCVRGEESSKHYDVAQDEDPEAVGDHDPFRRRPRLADVQRRFAARRIDGNGVHAANSVGCPRSKSAMRLEGISISSVRRNANASTAANPPRTPTVASHQMCQIREKPTTTAKNALTKPIGLLFGISIGSYSRSLAG